MTVYQIITDQIIKELESGIIPWQKPWTGSAEGAFNRISRKPYSILNQMLLRKPGEYATMKQWNELGGRVKKGERAHMVVFWKQVKTEIETADGEKKEKLVPMLRYYNVFHISQVDGVEPLDIPEPVAHIDPIAEAERFAAEYIDADGLTLEYVLGDRACYSPSFDRVTMPCITQFQDQAEFYSTLFHELTHSTGHKKRLDRLNGARFGEVDYAAEELVAEIGAACCLRNLGIDTNKSFRNSAAYIQGWIKALKNDPKMIVIAAGKAEKAVEYMGNAASRAAQAA